jgi:HD-like signal output (HDOD) protein
MKLSSVLEQPFTMPSIPKVVALLLAELDRREVNLRKVTHLIATDPALTSYLLQYANSEFAALRGTIHSVSEALALLKLSQVRAAVQHAAHAASIKAVPGMHLQSFWHYSINVARVSRSLAILVRLNQQAAFTCGLIHAIGEVALQVHCAEELVRCNAEIPWLDLRRADAEREILGFCYASVGAGFARRWNFPASMVDALEHQHTPFENDVYEPMAGVIHLAAWRARCQALKLDERVMAVTFPGGVGIALGLDIDMVLQEGPFDWAAYTGG